MQTPELLAVPSYYHELRIKADLNGITILKDGRFKKRYTGSKQYAVDINGTLHKANELKKLIGRSNGPGLKKLAPARAKNEKNMNINPKDTAKTMRKYTVNKPEIRQRLFSMIHSQPAQKKELYFWTITFPPVITDNTAHRIFNIWLTRLRKDGLLKNYLWIAERQTGERLTDKTKQPTNTIHFHLAIPHKMPVKVANRYMVSCLVTCAKNKEIDYSLYQCKRYNGVDIAKNRKEKKVTNFAMGKRGRRALVSYITKYITKNDSTFENLAWHNSRGFSQLFTGVTFTFEEFQNVYKLTVFVRRHSAINNEYFQYHPWINGPPPQLEGELTKLNSFIQNLN